MPKTPKSGLYKTTIVIWSNYDPENTELENLACDAAFGDAYCSRQRSHLVEKPEEDPDWEDTDFFSREDDG